MNIFIDKLKSLLSWSWRCCWILWFILCVCLIYFLRGPLGLNFNFAYANMFLNTLTPKFYVALTGTSSLISGLILIFEWWYFKKYGTSFIEQISLNHISPYLSNGEEENESDNPDMNSTQNCVQEPPVIKDCKLWRNPYSLFRGAEYQRLTKETGKEPLTYYDMNLTAQDHQTLFTCEADQGKPEYELMQLAWRERNPQERIKKAQEALNKNADCTTAMILLAEEDCSEIIDVEKAYKQAYKVAENALRKSQQQQQQQQQLNQQQNHHHHHHHHHQSAVAAHHTHNGGCGLTGASSNPGGGSGNGGGSAVSSTYNLGSTGHSHHDSVYRRDVNVFIFIRRRLAMCARKLGKMREAIKLFKDLLKEYSSVNLFNIHENLIECYLEAQQYADVQALLNKYDDMHHPKSATICYTTALLKARNVADKFSSDVAFKRGLNQMELTAVEAIHRAVEFNPHVPKYLLEINPLILPTEHILKRGDSEALAYTFFHLQHWKNVEGALNLLHCTWEGTFRLIPSPLEKGNLFYPYPATTESADRELLPNFHLISVYPKKDIPFFIMFTAILCSMTAIIAFLTHSYPEHMSLISKQIIGWLGTPFQFFVEKFDAILPHLTSNLRKL